MRGVTAPQLTRLHTTVDQGHQHSGHDPGQTRGHHEESKGKVILRWTVLKEGLHMTVTIDQ